MNDLTAAEIIEIINNYRFELECIMDAVDFESKEFSRRSREHIAVLELIKRIKKAEYEKHLSEGF